MSTSTLFKIAIVALLLIIAFVWDRSSWRRKSHEDLARMASGTSWGHWHTAIAELKRRGVDVSVYVPKLLGALLAPSKFEREAARHILDSLFPDLRHLLVGYSVSQDVDVLREKLRPAFIQLGVVEPKQP
jgi:hypothetical protein